MVADKRVIINGVQMMHGTSVKASRETNVSTTPTFDEVITQGTRQTPHSIDISKVSYEDLATFIELDDALTEMIDTPAVVTIEQDYYVGDDEAYTVRNTYYDCLLNGDDYEIKPEDHTVMNLKFKAGRLEREVIELVFEGE